MDRRTTGLKTKLAAPWFAAAIIAAVGSPTPVHAQTTMFQEPEIVVAATEGNVARIRELLAQKLDVNKRDSKGRTALLMASIGGEVEIAAMLLDGRARTDFADKLGNTPLNWASSQGEYDIVEMLLEAGADIDSQNKQGRTPLMLAASKGHRDIVRALLEAGADVTILDFTGLGALGWARDGRDPRIEQLLERAGATD